MSTLKTPEITFHNVQNGLFKSIQVRFSNISSHTYFTYTIRVYNGSGLKIDEISSDGESLYTDATGLYSVIIEPSRYVNTSYVSIEASCTVRREGHLQAATVSEVCENVSSDRFTAVTSMSKDVPYFVLKAFCNMPGNGFSKAYMYWESSLDGVTWNEIDLLDENNPNIDLANVERAVCGVFVPKYDAFGNVVDVEDSADLSESYETRVCWRVFAESPTDAFLDRVDLLKIPCNGTLDSKLYRATLLTIQETTEEDADKFPSEAKFKEHLILGQGIYRVMQSQAPEYLYSDIRNASQGTPLYYGNTLYMYGNPIFKNNLIASNPGEVVKPISKMTPVVSLEEAYLTAVVPWKDYLVCFTKSSVHLISKISDGFQAATVNVHIGIPEEDSQCYAATLNGVIFKSYDKLYLLYPNVYAATDTVTNVTEISQPIEEYLSTIDRTEDAPFALSTSDEYILMLPQSNTTKCVRYNYNSRTFTCHEYPVVFTSYKMFNVSEIRLFGHYTDANGNTVYSEFLLDAEYGVNSDTPYADILDTETVVPISFELDSGQKSDSLSDTKQFVESKFNFTTLHEKDSFPMRITVHVDGSPRVLTQDVSTDSSFWKQDSSHVGTLSTNFNAKNDNVFNVFRQMFIRYAGKGRSIRHIIEGQSLYPFKIYEIDYRYRNLNVKR